MKQKWISRVVIGLILMVMALSLFPVVAEGIDLTLMTDDEIVVLMHQVTSEIVRRGIEKTAILAKGAYIAGIDIPAGKYVFTCLAKGDDWGNVTIYSDQGNGKQLMWDVVTASEEGEDPETFFITLNENDELKSGVPFSLTIMTGVIFQ